MNTWIKKAGKARIYSAIAIFLRQIGRQNAASVRGLILSIEADFCTGFISGYSVRTIEVMTQLLKYHAPGIREIQIQIHHRPCYYYEQEKFNEQEKTLYQATADMIHEITWLKQLRITAFDENGQHRQEMEDLQALVNNRP